MSRHRASEPDDETTIIPKIGVVPPPVDDADATTVLPAVPSEAGPARPATPGAGPWAAAPATNRPGPAPQRPVPTPPPGRPTSVPPGQPVSVPPGRPTSVPPMAGPVSPAAGVSPAGGGPVSPAAGGPVSPAPTGQPVSGSPVSGSPVSGSPVSGPVVSGQPAYLGPAGSPEPGPDGGTASADETTIIARIEVDPDQTSLVPRISDSTSLIGIIPEIAPADGEEAPKLRYRDTSGAPIRAVRMKDAYASAYSDYTRVTVGSVIRTTLRTTGELLITFGLVILLFAAYEVWGKTAIVDAHQGDLDRALTQEWDSQPVTPLPTTATKTLPPPPGNAIGRLYIPRLGKHWVIVQGVAPEDIRYAPGHYPNSAMPGEKGNFAIAGHRMRSVFWDLDQLEVGDKIIVETQRAWYVYAVVKERIVRPYQVEVVSAAPPGVPAGKLLTLTTCNPKWDNYQRLIIHAELVGQQSRAEGPPPEMGG